MRNCPVDRFGLPAPAQVTRLMLMIPSRETSSRLHLRCNGISSTLLMSAGTNTMRANPAPFKHVGTGQKVCSLQIEPFSLSQLVHVMVFWE